MTLKKQAADIICCKYSYNEKRQRKEKAGGAEVSLFPIAHGVEPASFPVKITVPVYAAGAVEVSVGSMAEPFSSVSCAARLSGMG